MQDDIIINFSTDVQGDATDIQLTLFHPFHDGAGGYHIHLDFHNTVSDEKGRYEDMTIPPAPGVGQSRLPGLVGQFIGRKVLPPLPSPRFPV